MNLKFELRHSNFRLYSLQLYYSALKSRWASFSGDLVLILILHLNTHTIFLSVWFFFFLGLDFESDRKPLTAVVYWKDPLVWRLDCKEL